MSSRWRPARWRRAQVGRWPRPIRKPRLFRDPPGLAWDAGQGIVERLGPQLLPLRGRGYDRADIRIHASTRCRATSGPSRRPSDRRAAAPPLPGNEPQWRDADDIEGRRDHGAHPESRLARHFRTGRLPIRRGGVDAKFGLDLEEQFRAIAGAGQPGAYSSGCARPTAPSATGCASGHGSVAQRGRGTEAVRFAVTSLATAAAGRRRERALEG